jgi:hypothetical protein
MNINKFTKAELISKIENLKKLEQQNSKKTEASIKEIKTSPTFIDIILKFKT